MPRLEAQGNSFQSDTLFSLLSPFPFQSFQSFQFSERTRQTARAVDQVVAQVSNLLYRRASSLHAVRTISRARRFGRSADWKSAIQQVGNLRYAELAGLAGLCQWP